MGLKIRNISGVGLLLTALLHVSTGCAQSQKEPASECFLIAITDAQRHGMDRLFDPFAVEHKLSIDKRDPGQILYRDPSAGVLIEINPFMGSYGAAAALVTDQQPDKCEVCKLFEVYTKNEVGKSFAVTACGDVKGFRVPELYNFNLHGPGP